MVDSLEYAIFIIGGIVALLWGVAAAIVHFFGGK